MSLDFQSELCCEAAPECSICFESIGSTAKYITKCQHTFHTGCINKWCKTNNSCPLCRTSPLMEIHVTKNSDYIYNPNVYNNYIINNIIIQNPPHGLHLDDNVNTRSYSNTIYNTSQQNNISSRTYTNINNYINQTINTINNSRNMNNNNNININNYIINNNMLIVD